MLTIVSAVSFAIPAATLAVLAAPGPDTVSYDTPSLDRWMYPFNSTPGTRIASSIFGTTGEPDFDNRDGVLIIGYDTSGEIPPGLGASAYEIVAVQVRVQTDGQTSPLFYDDTQDPWTVFTDPADPEFTPDADVGQPLELFGLDYRNGFDVTTFTETSPYGTIFGKGVRNAFAADFDDNGALVDISNHVDERYDPSPWATGLVPGAVAGDELFSGDTYVFDVNVADANIQAYFQNALDLGTLRLTVCSMHMVAQQTGVFPTLYMKENPLVGAGIADAAQIDITWQMAASIVGDLNGDGVVDTQDLLELLGAWGACNGNCPADLDASGAVDVADLLLLLSNWS